MVCLSGFEQYSRWVPVILCTASQFLCQNFAGANDPADCAG